MHGSPTFEILFGGILGIGFLTVISHASFYALTSLVVLSADVWFGVAMMGIFGLTRAIPMLSAAGMLTAAVGPSPAQAVGRARDLSDLMRTGTARAIRVSATAAGVAQSSGVGSIGRVAA